MDLTSLSDDDLAAHHIAVVTARYLKEGNEARPSTDALLGAATDWLDGLTVDEFLERLRD